MTKTNAQTYNINRTESKGTTSFVGYHSQYVVFLRSDNQLVMVNKSNTKDIKEVKLDHPSTIYAYDLEIYDDKLYLLDEKSDYTDTKLASENNYRSNKVDMVIYSLPDGKKQVSEEFRYTPKKSSLTAKLDEDSKYIYILEKDSQIAAYDLNLKKATEAVFVPKKSKEFFSDYDIDLSFLYALFKDDKSLRKLGFDITTSGQKKDTLKDKSSDVVNFSYEKIKDQELFFFKKYYQNFNVTKKDSSKTISLDFGQDRKILEFHHKDLKDGNVLLFGKWLQIEGKVKYFGLFSMVLDKNLKEVVGLKNFDLDRINTAYGEYPNKKYTGFIYTRLKNFDYTFYNEDLKVTVNTYQKNYTNLIDHIYILKIQDDGEMIVNFVVNQMKNDGKKSYLNNGYKAFMRNGKLFFLFYDNMLNLENPVASDKNFAMTEMGRKETLLVSCSYDINEDEFSRKQKVADRSTMKEFLELHDGVVFINKDNDSVNLYMDAENKKGKNIAFYVFNFVE